MADIMGYSLPDSGPPAGLPANGGTGSSPLPTGDMPQPDPEQQTGGGSSGGGINLASLLASITQQNSQISGTIVPKITAAVASGNNAGQAIVAAVTQKGDDDALVQQTQATAQLKAQVNMRAVASSLGTNMDDSSQILTKLGQTMLSEYDNAQQTGQALDQLKQVNFLDDPLGWVSAQFQLPQATAQYNQHANTYNRAEATMQQLLTLTNDDNKVQNDIAATKDASSVAASTDAIKQTAIAQAGDAQLKAAQFNIAGMDAIEKMSAEQIQNSAIGLNAQVAAGHLALAQEQLSIVRQTSAQEMEFRSQAIQKGQMDIDAQNDMEDTINKGLVTLGRQPLAQGKATAMLKVGGDAGELVKKAFIIGNSSDVAGSPVISTNPGDAARTIIASKAPLTASTASIKSMLINSFQEAASDKTIDVKNPTQVDSITTRNALTTAATMQSRINPADSSNIYAAPDIKSVVAQPAVAALPFTQKVIDPLVASGATKFDPQLMLSLAQTAIKSGTVSFDDAVKGLTVYGNQAVNLNNVNRNYVGFGLPPQTSLNFQLEDPLLGNHVTVDMTNSQAISRLLTRGMYSQTGVSQKNPLTDPNFYKFDPDNLLGTK